jgi:hypothetical protein
MLNKSHRDDRGVHGAQPAAPSSRTASPGPYAGRAGRVWSGRAAAGDVQRVRLPPRRAVLPHAGAASRLATAVFGDHLWALRLPATACTVATAVLVALTARELGGGRVAQTLAALGAGSAELIFGHLLLTNPVDDVVWSAVLLFVIRALTRAHELLPAQHRVGTSLPAQRSSATRIKEGVGCGNRGTACELRIHMSARVSCACP